MSIESFIDIQSFEHLKQFMDDEKNYILFFDSRYCNICHNVFPKLLDLVDAYQIKIAKINITEHLEIAGQFTVFTTPTILIFHQGKEIMRNSRFVDYHKINKTLEFIHEVN